MKKVDIINTAAGYICPICNRGFYCWTEPDSSPCRHSLDNFTKKSLRKYIKKVPENYHVVNFLKK